MSQPKLAVVLLNYANWRDTVECLESLVRSTYQTLAVVVVDCGSPNDSVERLSDWVAGGADVAPTGAPWRHLSSTASRRPSAVDLGAVGEERTASALPLLDDRLTLLVAKAPLGFAAGCNAGIGRCLEDPDVDYLWLLNNDTVAAPDAADRLTTRAEEIGPSLGALGTTIADYRSPNEIQILGGGRVARFSAEAVLPGRGLPVERASDLLTELGDIDYVSGASLLTSPGAYRRVGPLDETMHLYWEDTDWCTRARGVGLTLAVCPHAVVWHKGQASTGGISRHTKFHHFRSAAVYLRRHRRSWRVPLAVRLVKSMTRDVWAARPADAVACLRGLLAGLRVAGSDPVCNLPIRAAEADRSC